MVATSREMLFNAQGLVVNAYHDAEGRQNYFPGSSGTSEGQFAMISGCLEAYKVTGDPLAKRLGELALSGVLTTLYRRGAIPETVGGTEIFAPHWLFNVKYPFTSTQVHLYQVLTFTQGVAYLSDPAQLIRYVYHARSMNSQLLWDNPYSALSAGQFYAIESSTWVSSGPSGPGMRITLSDRGFSGSAYVAFSDRTGPVIETNEPFEAWPDWRTLDRGEIDCAVDTLVWANHAFELAYQVFGNPTWSYAAKATRQQAVQAYDINDSRDWIKPSWSSDPFSVGSSFGFSNRQPLPVFSRDQYGRILITVGRGNGEVQYGNASRLDVYRAGDYTEVYIGSNKPVACQVYIDKYQNFSPANRYAASLNLAGTGVQKFVLHVADFVSLGPLKDPLTAGSPVYTVGVTTNTTPAHEIIIERIRQLPPLSVKYYPGAIPFTANFLGSPAQLIDWRGPVYMGYQSPDMWCTIGNQAAAQTCVGMLRDAQTAFVNATGAPKRGPFAPVFYFRRADAVQYGPPDTFGWEGPDPNTIWAGYQYRPLVELAKATWQLTNPSPAVAVVRDFLNYLGDAAVWPVGEGPPTDYPDNKPLGERNYPEPHFAALIMRAVIYLDRHVRPNGAQTGPLNANDSVVLDKCMLLLDSLWQTSGSMRGTFSWNPSEHEWYGFHHAEILTTLSVAVEWGEGTAQRPEIAAQCRVWIRDMLRWARANIYSPPNPAGDTVWTPRANWGPGIEETFAFETEITTSFNGREQRISLRERPRRSLQLAHTIGKEGTQAYDSLVRNFQNRSLLVPQWHLAQTLQLPAPRGTRTLTLTEDVPDGVEWGAYLVLSHGAETVRVRVETTDGNTVELVQALSLDWPSGANLVPTYRGLMNSDLSVARRTSAVTEASVTFDMLPQEDNRRLPVAPAAQTFTVGTDTREVILTRQNWASSVQVRDTWGYDTVAYADGPVVATDRESYGHRQLQAYWSFSTKTAAEQFLGLVHRLQGRRVAAWLPSGMLDFEPVQDIEANSQLVVRAHVADYERLKSDPATAIALRTISGVTYCARVTQVSEPLNNVLVLTLDRSWPQPIGADQVAMICQMYRVRMASDEVTLRWVTDRVSETVVSFTTVFNET